MGFGKSKQKSENTSQSTSTSLNQAYPFIKDTYGSQTALTGSSSNAIANLLGLNGGSAQDSGFENFKNSSGYNFVRDEGLKGITGNLAAKGMLNSGSALKAISGYNNNLASTFLDRYLSQLTSLSNTGLGAGQLISSAGNTANSQSTSFGTSSGSSSNLNLA